MTRVSSSYQRLEYPDSPATLEALAAWLHTIYQDEARRQATFGADTVRHPDAYDSLPEHTKDYDRALAIFIMDELLSPTEVRNALEELGGI